MTQNSLSMSNRYNINNNMKQMNMNINDSNNNANGMNHNYLHTKSLEYIGNLKLQRLDSQPSYQSQTITKSLDNNISGNNSNISNQKNNINNNNNMVSSDSRDHLTLLDYNPYSETNNNNIDEKSNNNDNNNDINVNETEMEANTAENGNEETIGTVGTNGKVLEALWNELPVRFDTDENDTDIENSNDKTLDTKDNNEKSDDIYVIKHFEEKEIEV